MKIARFFAIIFACIGVVLLVGSMGFLLMNQDAPTRILEMPGQAVACSDAFARLLDDGNLTEAASLIYGQPDLGVEGIPDTVENALLWDAFVEGISFAYTGECYAVQAGLARDAVISTLDVAGVTEKLPQRVQALVDQRIASAENLADIYDEKNNFREELVSEILTEALEQALSQDAETVTREVTIQLINRDGRWWVVPDPALLRALSGVA